MNIFILSYSVYTLLLCFTSIFITEYSAGKTINVYSQRKKLAQRNPRCDTKNITLEKVSNSSQKIKPAENKEKRQENNLKTLFNITSTCNGILACEVTEIVHRLNSSAFKDTNYYKLITNSEFNISNRTQTFYLKYNRTGNHARICTLEMMYYENATILYAKSDEEQNVKVEVVECVQSNEHLVMSFNFQTQYFRIDFQFRMPEEMCTKNEDVLFISLVTSAALLMILTVVVLILLKYFGIIRFHSNAVVKMVGSDVPKDQSAIPRNQVSQDDDSHVYNDTESDSESDIVFLEMSSCVMLYPIKPQQLVEPSQKPDRYRRMSSEIKRLNSVSITDEHVRTNEEPEIKLMQSNETRGINHIGFNENSEIHLQSASNAVSEHIQSAFAVKDQDKISYVAKESPMFSRIISDVNSHYSRLKHLQIIRPAKSTYSTVEVNKGRQLNLTIDLVAKEHNGGRRNSF